MLGSKAVDTLIEPNHRLGEVPKDGVVDKGSYQKLVEKLIYLAHTRSDIAFCSECGHLIHAQSQEDLSKSSIWDLALLKGDPRKRYIIQKRRSNVS